MKRTKLQDRILPKYTKGEEIANMVTHIIGGAIGLVALVLCIIFAAINDNVYGIIGGIVFGVTMILLYTMSSVYHGLSPNLTKAKKVFQVIDHCTIFLLIAGTYTPIVLCPIRDYNPYLGWGLFGIVWFFAILGIILNAIDLKKYKIFSMICYLAMGWAVIVIFDKIVKILEIGGTTFLLLGGVLYTAGALFYMIGSKKKYFHTVFHIFVDLGSLMHFFCILFYVI